MQISTRSFTKYSPVQNSPPFKTALSKEPIMPMFKSFTSIAILMLCTPTFANANDTKDTKAKSKADASDRSSKGRVVIEIDGTTQIIEPGADPALLKKQLRNISEALNNQKTKASGKDSKAITGGSFTYHTIIVGPDGVVHEEKHEKKLGDNLQDRKLMLKNLPEEVRKQIEAAMKKGGKPGGLQMKIEAGNQKEMKLDGLLKGVDSNLPAEMQKQLAEALKGISENGMSLGNMKARAIIIDSDGNTKEYSVDNDKSRMQSIKKSHDTSKANSKKTPTHDAKIMNTLQQILKRLDKIENEIDTLKKSQP